MRANRRNRRLSALVLFTSLAFFSSQAMAQAPEAPADEESKGRVFDGYFLTGIFAFGALFVVGKSARRS